MKKFFISFLATMAGIWLSLILLVIGTLIFFGICAAMGSSDKKVNIGSNTVLKLNLAGSIVEKTPKIKASELLMGELPKSQRLSDITGSIRAAAADDNISGIVIDCAGFSGGVAQIESIVEALRKFKADAPDKWVYAYSDFYEQGEYYIAAAAADSLFLNPVGMVDVNGLQSTSLFFKNLLDKIGVEMQVVKVGTYKSAVEPFILDKMSAPAREQMQLYLDNIWGFIAEAMASGRGVDVNRINSWADNYLMTQDPDSLVSWKVVDALRYRHEFDEAIASLVGKDDPDDVSYVTTTEYARAKDLDKKGSGKGATIAVLYAVGDITDTEGDGIVAADMVPQILDLADDEDIDGLILRVNSGGGSAFASEQIWEALEQYKKISGKPYYVSMSDYAASGGYYISCGADKIFAQPGTLTGSIGIFGLIPNAQRLLNDKIGITTSVVKTNAGSSLGIFEPMSPEQKAAMQAYVSRGYENFTARCAEGRGMSQDSIKAIGEGRVWDGSEALKIGLIDELGTLDDAIAAMAAQLSVDSYTLVAYPKSTDKWLDMLMESGIADLRAAMVRHELGEAADTYFTLKSVSDMSRVQCRMEPVEISL